MSAMCVERLDVGPRVSAEEVVGLGPGRVSHNGGVVPELQPKEVHQCLPDRKD